VKEKISKHPIYLRLREVLNVATDREMAEMLNVTPQSVNGWKRTGKIKRQTLESVASLKGVSFVWLFTGEGAKYPTKIQKSVELTAGTKREGQRPILNLGSLTFVVSLSLNRGGAGKQSTQQALRSHDEYP